MRSLIMMLWRFICVYRLLSSIWRRKILVWSFFIFYYYLLHLDSKLKLFHKRQSVNVNGVLWYKEKNKTLSILYWRDVIFTLTKQNGISIFCVKCSNMFLHLFLFFWIVVCNDIDGKFKITAGYLCTKWLFCNKIEDN